MITMCIKPYRPIYILPFHPQEKLVCINQMLLMCKLVVDQMMW